MRFAGEGCDFDLASLAVGRGLLLQNSWTGGAGDPLDSAASTAAASKTATAAWQNDRFPAVDRKQGIERADAGGAIDPHPVSIEWNIGGRILTLTGAEAEVQVVLGDGEGADPEIGSKMGELARTLAVECVDEDLALLHVENLLPVVQHGEDGDAQIGRA